MQIKLWTICLIYFQCIGLFYKYKCFSLISFFMFILLLFSEIYEQSKWCLIHIFYGSSENFGKYTFILFPALWSYLINSLFYNAVNFIWCIFNYAGGNFSCLINYIPPGVWEVISIQKASCLPFSSLLKNLFYLFFLFR